MTKLSLAVVGLAALVSVSGAIDLTEYTVTESQYDEAYVKGSFDWQDGNQEEQSYDGEFNAYYETIHSTAPLTFTFRADVEGEVNKGGEKDAEKSNRYSSKAKATINKYLDPDASKLFLSGDLDVGYKKNFNSTPDDAFSEVTFSVGYGRIYIATPLAKAIRIINDLKKYNQITGEPSSENYIKLAKLLDSKKEKEYESKHGIDEYKKYWFKDIVAILKSSGIVKGQTLGAFGIIKIDEILGDSGATGVGARKHGMELKIGISKELSDYDGETDDGAVKASFEYALPINLTAQFTNLLTYKASLEDGDTGHTIENDMGFLYELNDKIDWDNKFYYRLSKENEDADYEKLGVAKSGYLYHLTNSLDATAYLELSKADTDDDLNKAIRLGVSYRLR